MKFKVGDTVRLAEGADIDAESRHFFPERLRIGEERKVYSIRQNGVDVDGVWYRERELVLVDSEEDMVNHPSHYQIRHTEVFDFIEDMVGCIPSTIDVKLAMKVAYSLGNVAKYILRSPYKGKFVQDLRKAKVYLDRALDLIDGEDQ